MTTPLPENIIAERDGYNIKDDKEYYFYRGKLEALKSIAKFLTDGGGTYRSLCYDYLDVDYCGGIDHGGMEITNFVFEALEKKEEPK